MSAKDILGKVSIFVAGAAVGAGAAYALVIKPERDRHDEELKDQADYYKSKYDRHTEIIKNQEQIKAEGSLIRETQEKLEKLKTPYDTFSDVENEEEFRATLEHPPEDPRVYDIDADDIINGCVNYEKTSLRMCSDGVVVDENNEVVNGDELIGTDNLNRLLDGDEEGLYLRNDDLCIDYEIDKIEEEYRAIAGEDIY